MQKQLIAEISKGSKNALLKQKILCYYINNGDNTIADLGKEMGLSVPTVTKLINELISDGFVLDLGKVETNGGRRPYIYGLNQDSGYFIGVDLKKFHINIGIINFKGTLIHHKMNIPFLFENTPEKLTELCDIINQYIKNKKIPISKIINIGLNIPGRVNSTQGNSFSFFYFEERPLTEIMEEKIGVKVSIDNDSRAMTYGEYLNGIVAGEKNVIFINLSWGVGAGLITNGNLIYGKSGFSGEIGHFPMFESESLCKCGKKGCLETACSGSYIQQAIIQRIQNGDNSKLSQKVEKKGNVTLQDIVEAALTDDPLCIELIEEVGQAIGRAIAGLINLLNPELVVIGGTLSETGDFLMLPIRSSVKKHSLSLVYNDTELKLSKLGKKAGIIGACLLARSKILGLI